MSDLIQAVKGTALSVAEYFTPVLKQSKFKQTGVLTPEEFVIAGDHLVHQCPTWSWSPASDTNSRKPYLPEEKQYLVTKSVPCYKRCKDIEYCNNDEKVIMTENDEEGWVDTHHSDQVSAVNEMIDVLTLSEEAPAQQPQFQPHEERSKGEGEEEDEEAEDMEQFMNMVDEEDEVSFNFLPLVPTLKFYDPRVNKPLQNVYSNLSYVLEYSRRLRANRFIPLQARMSKAPWRKILPRNLAIKVLRTKMVTLWPPGPTISTLLMTNTTKLQDCG